MRGPRSNPWRWLTDDRITHALKLWMVVVLAFYLGQFVLEVLGGIRGVVYILSGAELGGLFGMLVAVPIAGVLRVLALRVVRATETK